MSIPVLTFRWFIPTDDTLIRFWRVTSTPQKNSMASVEWGDGLICTSMLTESDLESMAEEGEVLETSGPI